MKKVDLTVPYGTDVTSLIPTIVHTGASVSPNTGIVQNYTNPVTYTVTAADSTTQEYVVTVTVAANPAKAITSFDFATPSVTGTVDEGAKTVALTVPYGTDVTSLTPTIVHTGASVSPNTGIVQNYTNPVTYTVTAADSTTQEYVVTVTVAAPSSVTTIQVKSGYESIITGLNNEDGSEYVNVSGQLTVAELIDAIESTDDSQQSYVVYDESQLNNGTIVLNANILNVTAENGDTSEYDISVTYGITVAAVDGGNATVTTNPENTSQAGQPVGVEISGIESGLMFESISVTDESSGSVSTAVFTPGEVYTFEMPASNVTITVTLCEDQTSITPTTATFDNNDGSATISVTAMVDADGTNLLPTFTSDDGTLFVCSLMDDDTSVISVGVSNVGDSADLVISSPSAATIAGAYTLSITRVSDGKEWTIAVTVTST
ncbi:DUF5018 domain-containing protein [Methanolobus sp. ZRKC5]|uniref:DUF5018 domain-containing protein n=1 Tax=unclassified Methanolobus TaxID=2629569 RepID=UPI00313BFDFD